MKNFDKNDPKISERIFAENTLAFAFLNRMPIVPGHSLICPKRTVKMSSQLSVEEWHAILALKDIVSGRLQKVLGAEGYNFAWNEDEVAGQTVPHFHLHVVPRKLEDAGITSYEPRVFLYRPGIRPESPETELKNLANALRTSR